MRGTCLVVLALLLLVAVGPRTAVARPTREATHPWVAEQATAAPDLSEVVQVQTARPVLALTFDAGGELGTTMTTMDELRQHGVHATFFVSGRFAEQYPEAVQQMVADGHELANHSYSHPDLTRLPDWEVQDELEHADAILSRFSGKSTVPLMRFPYGSRDARTQRLVQAIGYRSIFWTLDGLDWRPEWSAQAVAARVLRAAAAGDVVLDHCATDATAGALPTILDGLAARGLQVVTVSDLLAGG